MSEIHIQAHDTGNQPEGQTWDTTQLQEDFAVRGFAAPFVVVTRKADGVKGVLEFRHNPRIYFNFTEAS